MRKVLILLLFVPCALMAQKENSGVAPGASFAYAEEAGINLRFHYFPSHKVCFGIETNIFPKSGESLSHNQEITLNGHYIFPFSEHWGVYPIGGVGWKKHEEESGFRALTGLGLHGTFDQVQPYVEYIYGSGFQSEGILIVGTFITIQFGKHEE